MIWFPYTSLKSTISPLSIQSASKEFLFDREGKHYIDAVSSWWVSIHGHNHPFLIEAVKKSLENLDQVILAGYTHENAERLAARLIEFTGNRFHTVFYSDNGSCAIEIALKMSVQYFQNIGLKDKTEILHFSSSYHGDTLGAMSVGGDSPFNFNFKSMLFSSPEFPSPDCASCPINKDRNSCKEDCLSSLEIYLQKNHLKVAAIILEPLLQGAGGMKVYKPEILTKLRALCDTYNVLLIFDEIFTGFGRTGKNFAFEHSPAAPDIITLSKGLTGGVLPLAVTMTSKKVYDGFYSDDPMHTFFHGHSMTGNPSGCAVALASIELYEKENRLADVLKLENFYKSKIIRLKENFSGIIQNERILGSICAFEVDGKSNYLNSFGKSFSLFARDNGVVLRPLGNTVYIAPPYIISEESLETVFDVIDRFLVKL